LEETRITLLEKVLNAYGRWYNIERTDASGALVAKAAYHENDQGYVLIKAAKTWSASRHEYAFFYSVPHLDKAVYEACLAQTRELGEPLVNPVKGHMSTYLVMVILCDTADADALEALKSCRIQKSFQFSLRGWMEIHTAAIEVGKASVTANSLGYNTAKFLKNILCPPKQRRGLFSR